MNKKLGNFEQKRYGKRVAREVDPYRQIGRTNRRGRRPRRPENEKENPIRQGSLFSLNTTRRNTIALDFRKCIWQLPRNPLVRE